MPAPIVARIIKLGGAAITRKDELETLNEEALNAVSADIAASTSAGGPASEHMAPEAYDTIVVHGAGSFGHFQASQYGVSRGGLHNAGVRKGFALTRQSVLKLHQLVVGALLARGVNACGQSPCGSWSTDGRKVAQVR